MNNLNSGIYKITNITNNKCYIGSAVSITTRFRSHINDLKAERHHNRYLQRAWNKYGQNQFTFETIIYCNKKNLIFYEQRAIDVYKDTKQGIYNHSLIAESLYEVGHRHSEESKLKMREAKLGYTPWNKGKTGIFSPETLAIMSEKKKNKPPPNKGIPCTDEHKKKISEANKGREGWCKGLKLGPRSQDTKNKISIGNKGKIVSDKVKEKLKLAAERQWSDPMVRDKMLKSLNSDNVKEKQRNSSKNRICTDKTREKLRVAAKKQWADKKAKTKPIRIPYL